MAIANNSEEDEYINKKEKVVSAPTNVEKLEEIVTKVKFNSREEKFYKKKKIVYGKESTYRRHPKYLDSNILKKEIKNRRVRKDLENQQKTFDKAVKNLADTEILLPFEKGFLECEGFEKSYKILQSDFHKNIDRGTKKKLFDLKLSYGPYVCDYELNGRHLLLAGRRGIFSMIDTHTLRAKAQINVHETIRDVKFLHNYSLFAVAQKKHAYIYDNNGIEIHCLKDLMLAYALEFLPFHFLLVSIGEFGMLRYLDVSTGTLVASHKTGNYQCDVLKQNKKNATVFLGQRNGAVSVWTPNSKEAVVKVLCHKGPVTALDIYDNYLVTSGIDGVWRVWDMRKYSQIECVKYFGGIPRTIDISQNGFIGIGFASHVQLWSNSIYSNYMYFSDIKRENSNSNNALLSPSAAEFGGNDTIRSFHTTGAQKISHTPKNEEAFDRKMPYITHDLFGQQIERVRFCPYEDVVCIGHTAGISTILAPGISNPNFDSFYFNPYQTNSQRRENEIHRLLEKLQPDMISLNTNLIGNIDDAPKLVQMQEKEQRMKEKEENVKSKKAKNKKRGKSKIENKLKVSNAKVAENQRIKTKKRLEEKTEKEEDKKDTGNTYDVFDRFRKKEKPTYT